MPADKGKVKAALDTKFKGKSVSKELKEAYATRGADLIETDEDIQTWVDNMEGFIMDAAKEADRRAQSAAQKAKQEAADAVTGNPPKTDAEPDPIADGAPDWFRAFMAKDAAEKQALADKVTGFEQARTTETLETQLRNHEKLKGWPEAFFKGRVPQKPEDLDAAVEAMVTDFGSIVEKLGTTNFGGDTPAGAPAKGGNAPKEASKEQLDAVMANMPI